MRRRIRRSVSIALRLLSLAGLAFSTYSNRSCSSRRESGKVVTARIVESEVAAPLPIVDLKINKNVDPDGYFRSAIKGQEADSGQPEAASWAISRAQDLRLSGMHRMDARSAKDGHRSISQRFYTSRTAC